MPIQPISRRSLSDVVAGKLAASMLDGNIKSGEQLPPERELMKQFDVSRSTLREALKVLADNQLIEARQGVGWFVKPIDHTNFTRAHSLSASGADMPPAPKQPAEPGISLGPRRLPAAPEKPLHIPNLRTDRLGTFDFISWWERKRVEEARVLVVGAGALGNEVIQNLALMGIGYLYIIDFDTIEAANLSRSPLFREGDTGRSKAEVAAARARELNPNIHIQYLHGDVTSQLGLGVFRRMDVIIGCLDNREARLAVNRFAYWMNKPWVDGAIQELLGLVRVFIPGQGACFECTLNDQARRDLAVRYSCPLLARQNILLGKVPTTPTIASIIGAMQSQEALKLLHGIPVEAGKVVHFNGMINEMHTTSYNAREDCESHWTYGDVIELPASTHSTSLYELFRIASADLGPGTVIELDQELILTLKCPRCGTLESILKPISEVSFEAAHCPSCGVMRETEMTHAITGKENFLHRTLASIGVPPLHILRAFNSREFRFYELSGDLEEAFHFSDFQETKPQNKDHSRQHIRLGKSILLQENPASPAQGKVTLKD